MNGAGRPRSISRLKPSQIVGVSRGKNEGEAKILTMVVDHKGDGPIPSERVSCFTTNCRNQRRIRRVDDVPSAV